MSESIKVFAAALVICTAILVSSYAGYRITTQPCQSESLFVEGDMVEIKMTGEQGMVTYVHGCGLSYSVRISDMSIARMKYYELSEIYHN